MRHWVVWFIWPLALAGGCQRTPQIVYVASEQVRQLPPELQTKLRAELEKYCGTPARPKLLGDQTLSAEHLAHGAAVYQQRCAGCHGATGDGAGEAAEYLYPRPRDYRRGIFKFVSTAYGGKPTRGDLVRFVRHGARGTSMPSFALLADEDLEAVIDYVLVLSHRGELEFQLALAADDEGDVDPAKTPELLALILEQWQAAPSKVIVPATRIVPYSEASIELGKQAFASETAGCHKCHGLDGTGKTSENQKGFTDVWNHQTRAADLTNGAFHGGNRPIDIFRRMYGGINGTPMPAFDQKLQEQPETFWHLVNYVYYISSARRREIAREHEERSAWKKRPNSAS